MYFFCDIHSIKFHDNSTCTAAFVYKPCVISDEWKGCYVAMQFQVFNFLSYKRNFNSYKVSTTPKKGDLVLCNFTYLFHAEKALPRKEQKYQKEKLHPLPHFYKSSYYNDFIYNGYLSPSVLILLRYQNHVTKA